jgi:energy-coupling factor transporter ATP-binding protein EcfA2
MLRIINLNAINVHGYIPVDIKFNEHLTFLTGSNGCGKTTALKIISALLQPNIELIDSIEFNSITLTFSIESKIYDIQFNRIKDKFQNDNIEWSISSKSKKKIHLDLPDSRKGAFRLFPKHHGVIFNREESTSLRESVYNEFVNSEYYIILKTISTPVFLGIDRKVIGSDEQLERRIHNRNLGASINERSYYDAQRIIIDYVSTMADKKKELSEKFKLNIFKSLFEYVEFDEKKAIFSQISNVNLEKKKSIVLNSIQKLELGNAISEAIEHYYNLIGKIQPLIFQNKPDKRNLKDVNEWIINRSHLHRIEAISRHAVQFQEEIDKLDKPLNEIARLANLFFQESNKSLRINPSGFIHVYWSDRKITSRNLSSGEIQIIVLLTHLVFCEYRMESSVFVIDEPELSLHLSWQEKFVDAILEASPSTQFILATHSPALISKFEYEQKAIYIKSI